MLQITQLCGLCCVEETAAKLVYCDTFLAITAVTNTIIICTVAKEVRCNGENIDGCKKYISKLQSELTVTSYYVDGPELVNTNVMDEHRNNTWKRLHACRL